MSSTTMSATLLLCCGFAGAYVPSAAVAAQRFSPAAIAALPTASRTSPVVARANTEARKKAKSVAMTRMSANGRRKPPTFNEFGVVKTAEDKAGKRAGKRVDVMLLKDVDGVGVAGDIVAVARPMFDNVLRRTGKARLPRAAEVKKALAEADAAPVASVAEQPLM